MTAKINRFIDKLSIIDGYIAGVLLGIMTLVVFTELLVRGVGKPITATTEITSFLFPWIVGFSALPITRENQQMALTFITSKFKGRTKWVFEIITNLLVIWFSGTMFIGGIKLSYLLRADTLPISGISKVFVYSAIVMAFLGILVDYTMKTIAVVAREKENHV
jgi:TRAP-type C4-dicarboxylate transport system permease small subunit